MPTRREKTMDLGGLDIVCRSITVGATKPSPYNLTSVPGISSINSITSGAGTVTTTATTVAEEYQIGPKHFTKLTMTNFAIGTSADNASLAIGAKFYTLPAGEFVINMATIYGGITAAVSVTSQTPEVSIGTVIASGAIATMTTATFENVVDGGLAGLTGDSALVAPDVAGGLFRKGSLSTVAPVIKVSGGLAHDLFLNVAVAWADVTAAGAVTFTGVIELEWTKIA